MKTFVESTANELPAEALREFRRKLTPPTFLLEPTVKRTSTIICATLIAALWGGSTQQCFADDWPQWAGPQRDSEYRETGIVDEIPAGGLPVLWRTPISSGYSGPAVADGKVFITDYVAQTGASTNGPGTRDPITGQERVLCLDAKTGDVIWNYEYDRPYNISYGSGPRATPTVDGDRVYVLGAEGDLLCLETANGKVVWHLELAVEFPSKETPIWGHAAHPLVHGELLYCLGGNQSVAVALNKHTGDVIWKNLTANEIGYCPPVIHNLRGKETLVIWHPESVNGLEPKTGKVLWSIPLRPQYSMSLDFPKLHANRLFATGIGKTSTMVEIGSDGKPAKTVWKGKTGIGVYAGNSPVYFDEDAIYGADCESGKFFAVDPDNGTRLWETLEFTSGGNRRAGSATGFLVKHEDKFFVFTETGDLVIAELSPKEFKTRGRMHVLEATNTTSGRSVVWSHPAFAGKCMFARNDKEIVCVSLAK